MVTSPNIVTSHTGFESDTPTAAAPPRPHHDVADVDELLIDVTQQAQARLNLQVRVGRLHRGGHERQVLARGAGPVTSCSPRHRMSFDSTNDRQIVVIDAN